MKASRIAFACLAWAALLAAPDASAQTGTAKGRVVTISEVTIVGRVQKPIAAVDVSRIQPKLTLAELRQPFIDRIEKGASSGFVVSHVDRPPSGTSKGRDLIVPRRRKWHLICSR
jgi:hypothetical protein